MAHSASVLIMLPVTPAAFLRLFTKGAFPALLCAATLQAAPSPSPEAIADLEAYVPPAISTELSKEGALRAKALALFYKGRRMEKELDDDLALAAYTAAMEIEPHNVSLASRMARLMASMEKYKEAQALLQKTLEQNPNDPDAYLAISRHCARNHQQSPEIKALALQYAKQAVDKFPAKDEVYLHLINSYFTLADKAGDPPRDKAREVLARAEQAATTDPEFFLAMLEPARKAYPLDDKATRDANLAAILKFADKAQSLAKDDEEVLEKLADFYSSNAARLKMMALYQKAIPLLEKIATEHQDNLNARRKLATTLRQTGDDAKSEKMFQELVRINPQDLESRRALIKIAETKNDNSAVISNRSEILRWEGGSPSEWLNLSVAMAKEQQMEEAMSLLKRARLAHPDDARIPFQNALFLRDLNRFPDAFNSYQEASELAERKADPKQFPSNDALLKNPDFTYTGAGIASRLPEQTDRAAELYRKSLALAPKDKPNVAARCYNDLGYLWLERNDKIDEAGELIRTALSMVKDHPGYLDSLGWFYFKKKEFPAALEQLEKAASLQKSPDPETLDHLAQTLWELNRRPEALAKLEQAAALPNAPEAVKSRLATFRATPP